MVRVEYMKGIDTILVRYADGPGDQFLPWPVVSTPYPRSVFEKSVAEVFAQHPWLKVTGNLPSTEIAKPNVIIFEFSTSARKEASQEKKLKVGALSLKIWRLAPDKLKHLYPSPAVPAPAWSYPFLVPETSAKLEQTLSEGTTALTDYLPYYFVCANKVGKNPCLR